MQVSPQEGRSNNGRFLAGVSGNPAGSHGRSRAARQARREALIASWTAHIGGPSSLTAVERDLLVQAAEAHMARPRTAEDVVRCANVVSKILTLVGLVPLRKEEPSVLERLARHD
jgi:hypothetical protein